MNNYHVIGVLKLDNQHMTIDQQLPAANVMEAMQSFEIDGWSWPSKVAVMRLPCTDEAAYSRQVAMARDETETFRAKPKQLQLV